MWRLVGRASKTWRSVRGRLTYANAMASLAVFIALGGTGYALTLPRNSVDSKQLRRGSVGTSELRRGAVRSRDIRDATIAVQDISGAARETLRGATGLPGPQGPSGVSYFAAVNAAGKLVRGNAATSSSPAIGVQQIGFTRSVAACVATATLAHVPGGVPEDPPSNARINIGPVGDVVTVRTWTATGTPTDLPFNLVVAC